jgi:hypothetical protein
MSNLVDNLAKQDWHFDGKRNPGAICHFLQQICHSVHCQTPCKKKDYHEIISLIAESCCSLNSVTVFGTGIYAQNE